MIDVDSIKQKNPLREVVEREIGYAPKSRTKHYDVYRCPLHRETKGYSFVAYDGFWTCYGKCQQSGDVIEFIKRLRCVDFSDAVQYLGGSRDVQQIRRTPQQVAISRPPDEKFQQALRGVIKRCVDTLWSPEGDRALKYLLDRGLSHEVIQKAWMGYLPGSPTEYKAINEYLIPCGITIPWIIDGIIWGLKVRRSAGQIKYQQVRGGNIAGALYFCGRRGQPLVLVEGEIDALSVYQCSMGITAAALGSASNARINPRWYGALLRARSLYLMMDDDAAGSKATQTLGDLAANARTIRVPGPYHDFNEFLVNDRTAAEGWIQEVVR